MRLALTLLLATLAFGRFSILSNEVTSPFTSPNTGYISLEQWFPQQIDHFNDHDHRTFEQRYFMNQKFWDGYGPLLVFIGGEGTLNGPPTDESLVGTIAKEHNGLILALEHRFYGKSIPFKNQKKPLKAKNLEFLNSRQALADLAHFIQDFKSKIPNGDSIPTITFGGSYPGALSAWFRLKYPHVTDASLASSAVVNSIANFFEFDEHIAAAVGDECAGQLRKVTALFEAKMKTKKGATECKKVFGFDDGYRDEDIWFLLADSQIIPTQYGQKPRLCKRLKGLDGEQLFKAYAKYAKEIFMDEYEPHGLCEYDTRCMAREDYRFNQNARQWYWQSCHELGWLQSSETKNPIRSKVMTFEYWHNWCKRAYGKDRKPVNSERYINDFYGGDLPLLTNVIFTNFQDDPWKAASIRDYSNPSHDDIGPSNHRLYGTCDPDEGCSHCYDMRAAKDSDNESIKEVRNRIREILGDIINQN
ncbi:hypothetical protein P9112_008830 [Eukaryota sp. TZLM1-RC]